VRSPPEETTAETMCDELGEKEVENLRVTFSPGRREGRGGGVFKIWVYFSLSCSDLNGNKLN